MPIRTGRVAIVMELERDVADPPAWWRVTLSIPGREGTLTRTWANADGRINQRDADDMFAWCVESLSNCIALSTGIQQSLLGH